MVSVHYLFSCYNFSRSCFENNQGNCFGAVMVSVHYMLSCYNISRSCFEIIRGIVLELLWYPFITSFLVIIFQDLVLKIIRGIGFEAVMVSVHYLISCCNFSRSCFEKKLGEFFLQLLWYPFITSFLVIIFQDLVLKIIRGIVLELLWYPFITCFLVIIFQDLVLKIIRKIVLELLWYPFITCFLAVIFQDLVLK